MFGRRISNPSSQRSSTLRKFVPCALQEWIGAPLPEECRRYWYEMSLCSLNGKQLLLNFEGSLNRHGLRGRLAHSEECTWIGKGTDNTKSVYDMKLELQGSQATLTISLDDAMICRYMFYELDYEQDRYRRSLMIQCHKCDSVIEEKHYVGVSQFSEDGSLGVVPTGTHICERCFKSSESSQCKPYKYRDEIPECVLEECINRRPSVATTRAE